MGTLDDDEEELLRSVALQNARQHSARPPARRGGALRGPRRPCARAKSGCGRCFNQAAVGIAARSRSTADFVDMNRKFSRRFSATVADELRATTFLDITHARRSRRTARLPSAAASPDRFRLLDSRSAICGRMGRRSGARRRVTLLKDADGRPQRFIGVSRTSPRASGAEEALREETRILELLNETGKILASKLDLQTLVQAVTDAATQLSGAQFGAFFYNIDRRERRRVSALHALWRAARGVRAVREAARDARSSAPPFAARRRSAATTCSRTRATADGAAPRHAKGHLPVRSYLAVPVDRAPAR